MRPFSPSVILMKRIRIFSYYYSNRPTYNRALLVPPQPQIRYRFFELAIGEQNAAD